MSSRNLRDRQPQVMENKNNNNSSDHTIVATPINKNNYIQTHQRELNEKSVLFTNNHQQQSNFNYFGLPGVGKISNINKDILLRIKFSLQSGIPNEIQWALNKLVYISNKSSHLLNLNNKNEVINDIIFSELIDKIISSQLDSTDLFLSNKFQIDSNSNFIINNILDSLLIIRNLCQDSENAYIFSSSEQLKSKLLIILTFVSDNELQSYLYDDMYDCFIKIYQFVIDIIEAITSYLSPSLINEDQFFPLLISNFDNSFANDRAIKISIMRSLARLMVKTKDVANIYSTDLINDDFLTKITHYLFATTDPELILTSLDFLYQFILPSKTNSNSRINILLSNLERFNCLRNIIPKLLTFNNFSSSSIQAGSASYLQLKVRVHQNPFEMSNIAKETPKLPENYLAQLNTLKEPLRATHWMRTCFQADMDHSVTQISLWKSYDSQFSSSNNKMLPAVDFIKNVTNAFPKSSAMVINEEVKDSEGNITNSRRFIIKGIKPRHAAVNIEEGTKQLLEDIKRIEKQHKENTDDNNDDVEMTNDKEDEHFVLKCGIQEELETLDDLHPYHQEIIKQCEAYRKQEEDEKQKAYDNNENLTFASPPANDITKNSTIFLQQIYQTCKNEPMSLGNQFVQSVVQNSNFLEMLSRCPWIFEELKEMLLPIS